MQPIPKVVNSTNLDMLRAVAVLCVYVSHLLNALRVARLGNLGRLGVIIFFVHTSLVLMESLQRLEVAAETKGRLVAAFWVRRIFRIYPLSILIVLAVVVFHVPYSPSLAYHWIGWKGLLANLALIQNLTIYTDVLSPLWSLPLEVQMYVVLPFAYFLLRYNWRYRSLVLWLLSIPIAILLPHLNWRFSLADYVPCFTSGIVAFDLMRYRKPGAYRLPSFAWPIGIALVIWSFNPFGDITGVHAKVHTAWVLSLAIALLYVNVREGSGRGIYRVFHWIAEHSYGIYLSHVILFWIFLYRFTVWPGWVRGLLLAGCSIVVPILLYRYIERPLMLAGGHISRRVLHPHVQRVHV